MPKNARLEFSHFGAQLQPELLVENRTRMATRIEGVSLPTGAIQRQHQLTEQPFAPRVLFHQRFELGHDPAVLSERELRVDPLLSGSHTQFVEMVCSAAHERFGLKLCERRSAPQPSGLPIGAYGFLVVRRRSRTRPSATSSSKTCRSSSPGATSRT